MVGEISQRRHYANPAVSINMVGHRLLITIVGAQLPLPSPPPLLSLSSLLPFPIFSFISTPASATVALVRQRFYVTCIGNGECKRR